MRQFGKDLLDALKFGVGLAVAVTVALILFGLIIAAVK